MTGGRRSAPHSEWVELYRQGIAPSRIAALDIVPVSTVRFHLQVAKKIEPGLEAEHKKALPRPARPSAAFLQTMQNVVAFYQAAGRLPSARAQSRPESTLGRWLYRRRKEAVAGTLSPAVRDGLGVIPGWDLTTRRKADDEARWQQRLQQVRTIREAGGEWPRHQKTDDPAERTLGVWLHGQRIHHNHGKMAPEKKSQLDKTLPGWSEGRPRGRRPGKRSKEKPSK